MQKSRTGYSVKLVFALLVVVVLIEGPVRLLLQPDPWLLHPSHWYFDQPLRIVIEFSIVVFLVAILSQTYSFLLRMSKNDVPLLVGAAIGTVALFGFIEFEQLKSSLDGSMNNILIWAATGFLIGVGQELIYRGLLYTSLATLLSRKVAALITVLLFIIAPLHSVRMWELFTQGEYGVVGILVLIYAAAGFFFQWLRDKSESIIVPGVAHGLGNAITWLAVFS